MPRDITSAYADALKARDTALRLAEQLAGEIAELREKLAAAAWREGIHPEAIQALVAAADARTAGARARIRAVAGDPVR